MYCLANRYARDFKHDAKFRILDLAKISTLEIPFNRSPKDLWYLIISKLQDNKLITLLEVIVREEGNTVDEYLIRVR